MIISNIKKYIRAEYVFVSCSVKFEDNTYPYKFPSELHFYTYKKYEDYITSDRYDGFLLGLLYPAIMANEKRIKVDGKISARLFDNLKRIISVLKFSLQKEPNFKFVQPNIEVESVDSEPIHSKKINGTAMSGGVDSLFAFWEYFYKCKDPNFKVSKIFFFNVGSHGNMIYGTKKADDIFWLRFRSVESDISAFELETVPLDSNLHTFHPWGHLRTEEITAASAILMFQNILSRYYFASAG